MNDFQSKINDIIDVHTATMRNRYTDELELLLELCESPIEKIFGAALLHDLLACPEFKFTFIENQSDWVPHGVDDNVLFAQYKIGRYRVDFFVYFEMKDGPIKIAIECDGHDYHERTKEQARNDRSKDRWFQSHGYRILRFTGSEIWKDPVECAEQVLKLIWNRLMS
jgi:very-short-patch-repair endonuclease